jgi:hypothetical protein
MILAKVNNNCANKGMMFRSVVRNNAIVIGGAHSDHCGAKSVMMLVNTLLWAMKKLSRRRVER